MNIVTQMGNKHYDVIVVGAGQAGLALGYYLREKNLSYLLLDQTERIGDSWRNRYDSLQLFTPRAYSRLPGMKLQGDQDGFPTKNEIADYLERYAKQFSLPILLQTNVEKIQKTPEGFTILTTKDTFTAKNVVIATGAFQKKFIPQEAGKLSQEIFQIHTKDYTNPEQIPKGTTLIIGAGNSGVQIAIELAKERKIILSSGHRFTFLPKRIWGRSLFSWWDRIGFLQLILAIPGDTALGTFIKTRTESQIIGTELKDALRKNAIALKPRAVAFDKRQVTFADNSSVQVDTIIWATGYRQDYDFIKIPDVLNNQGEPIHKRGITTIPGLFFLGCYWLHTAGSAVFLGIGKDAKFIAEKLSE